jgi:hypothetical protein
MGDQDQNQKQGGGQQQAVNGTTFPASKVSNPTRSPDRAASRAAKEGNSADFRNVVG